MTNLMDILTTLENIAEPDTTGRHNLDVLEVTLYTLYDLGEVTKAEAQSIMYMAEDVNTALDMLADGEAMRAAVDVLYPVRRVVPGWLRAAGTMIVMALAGWLAR